MTISSTLSEDLQMNKPPERLSEKDKRDIELDLWRLLDASNTLMWTLNEKFGYVSLSMILARKLDKYIMDLTRLIEEEIKEKSE